MGVFAISSLVVTVLGYVLPFHPGFIRTPLIASQYPGEQLWQAGIWIYLRLAMMVAFPILLGITTWPRRNTSQALPFAMVFGAALPTAIYWGVSLAALTAAASSYLWSSALFRFLGAVLLTVAALLILKFGRGAGVGTRMRRWHRSATVAAILAAAAAIIEAISGWRDDNVVSALFGLEAFAAAVILVVATSEISTSSLREGLLLGATVALVLEGGPDLVSGLTLGFPALAASGVTALLAAAAAAGGGVRAARERRRYITPRNR